MCAVHGRRCGPGNRRCCVRRCPVCAVFEQHHHLLRRRSRCMKTEPPVSMSFGNNRRLRGMAQKSTRRRTQNVSRVLLHTLNLADLHVSLSGPFSSSSELTSGGSEWINSCRYQTISLHGERRCPRLMVSFSRLRALNGEAQTECDRGCRGGFAFGGAGG